MLTSYIISIVDNPLVLSLVAVVVVVIVVAYKLTSELLNLNVNVTY